MWKSVFFFVTLQKRWYVLTCGCILTDVIF